MVKSAPGIPTNRLLNLGPVAVPMLVSEAEEHDVTFPREVLRLLSHSQHHLFDRPLVRCHFLPDQIWSLTFERMTFFSLLNVFGDLVRICEHALVLEETFHVFDDLLRGLGADVP